MIFLSFLKYTLQYYLIFWQKIKKFEKDRTCAPKFIYSQWCLVISSEASMTF